MMKPNRRRRERPNASQPTGSTPSHAAPRGSRPGKPTRGRPARNETPGIKEHPQYGTRIPPEELEFMRQQAEERARERKNRMPGSRPIGSRPLGTRPGAGRYGPRDGGTGGPRGPRPQGGSRYPGAGPHPGGPRGGRGGAPGAGRGGAPGAGRGYGGGGAGRERHERPHGAPYTPRERGTHPQRERSGYRSYESHAPATSRERFQGPPSARPERRPLKPYRTGVQSAGEGPPRGVPIPEEPPLSRLQSILGGYQQSAVLLAGHALGVFAEVQKRPQVASDLARRLDADPRAMEALLEAIVALGFLHRHGATYVLPRDLAPYFVAGAGTDATGMIEAASELYGAFGDLARIVRDGVPRVNFDADALLEGDPARARRYIRAVHTVSREAAGRVTELAPLPEGSSLLDVAGGSGVFAAEYARRTPGLQATLLDLPPAIEVAREILREEGYDDLVSFYPGDYRTESFPGPVDTVLLSNVLQTVGEEQGAEVLRKSYEALRPGGTLLIHGVMPSGATRTVQQAMFAVRMMVLFESGQPWTVEQVTEWLARERFAVRSTRPLGPPFQTTLIAASRLE